MENVVDGFFMRVLCLMALFSFSHSSIVIDGGVGSTSEWLLRDDGNLTSQVADLEAKVNKLAAWSEYHPFVRELVKRIEALEQKTDQQAGKIGTLELKTAQQLKEIETLERKTTRQLEEIQSLKTTIIERGKEWRVPSSFENQLNSSQKLVLETVDSKIGAFKQMEIRKLEQSFQDTMAQHRRERLQETQGVNDILAKQGKELDQAKGRLVSLEKSVTQIVKNTTDAFDVLKELFLNSTTRYEREMTAKLAYSSKVPSSCADLRSAGQTVSGLYQVQTKNTGSGKISTVFCDMTTRGSETFMGINDIKSAEIHFSVARTSSIVCNCTIIAYDYQWVNIGNAMNATTGVFTAPKAGIYSFTFNAVGADGEQGWIEIRRNSVSVAKSWITAGSSASAHVAISLNAGNRMDTFSPSAKLYSSKDSYSINFSGSLIAQL